jgi:hypothetical protein
MSYYLCTTLETSEVFGINSGVYQRKNFGSLKSANIVDELLSRDPDLRS